jgi:hypothetical protein
LKGGVKIETEERRRTHEIKGNPDDAADNVGRDARMGAE